ncbi:MAG: fumarate hydratase [Caldilineaceae bacterium]|nr:fumarate hydratase [Caldilineaceae bacterium]
MLRQIPVARIRTAVETLLTEAAYRLPADYLASLEAAAPSEPSPIGQQVIELLLENSAYAQAEQIATCQDTGMAMLFLEVGQDVHFTGGAVNAAIQDGVRAAYTGLRKSVVGDPIRRANTGDNTPGLIHYEIVPGDRVAITALQKGFGAELMSRLQMFPPSVGVEGVIRFVIETVELAGPNACPPVIVGVGLGGSFNTVAHQAKKALLRPIGSLHPVPHLAELEADLLAAINRTGIGPQGLGGRITALAVHIEAQATHIAALPVAVNLNCSAPRRARVEI